jgi:hypothetical protein
MTTQTATTAPRIYVACLAACNNGILHGAWIDADQDAWALYAAVSAMLRASPIAGAEEWAIHDYDGFEGIRLSEYMGLEAVAEYAAFITEHGALGAAAYDYFGDLAEAQEALADRYLGVFDSLASYIQDVTEECTEIPASLRYYIDWQAMARDAELSGDLISIETGHSEVHVFACR